MEQQQQAQQHVLSQAGLALLIDHKQKFHRHDLTPFDDAQCELWL